MNHNSYLHRLGQHLQQGGQRLPAAQRQRQQKYLRQAQCASGGFAGREGDADIYYTSFALRGLAVLGDLSAEVRQSTSVFLRRCLRQSASPVDFFSLLFAAQLLAAAGGPEIFAEETSDWPERTVHLLESFRTPDGGYGKTPGAAHGSTYYTFLVACCYDLLGRPMPHPQALADFLSHRQRADGGYVEIAVLHRSGVNPTAAALGAWQLLRGAAFSPREFAASADFLLSLQTAEGGFRAHARAPAADLLSTFTTCWTLAQLGALERCDCPRLHAYVLQLEQPQGGFRAGLWDAGDDVEYTFYGLGTLALLARIPL